MALSTRQLSSEKLIGFIERITFHSEKTGFCVLKVKARGRRDIVTVIAQTARVLAGESIEAVGGWTHHKNHGLQFNTTQLSIFNLTSLEGIEKYLGSGLVKGIGPYFAKQLVKVLGISVFDVIERTPERLSEVPGIGKKRQQKILAGWAEQKAIRDIMVFLQGHGLGTSRAFRIYKTYGKHAIEKVKENPYRLASDIHGIGFKTSDQLAKSLGLPEDSPLRARAGLQHALQLAGQEGHCALLQTDLIQATHKLLSISESLIVTAIAEEVVAKQLVQNSSNDNITVALKSFYQAEVFLQND